MVCDVISFRLCHCVERVEGNAPALVKQQTETESASRRKGTFAQTPRHTAGSLSYLLETADRDSP
jgi:hypothetical protein